MPDIKNPSQKSTALLPATRPTIAVNRAAVATQAQQTLNLLHGRLSDAEARVSASANALLAQAQSTQVQALAQNSADVKEQLPALLDSLQKVSSATQANQKTRSQGLSTLLAKLQPVAPGNS